MSQPTEPSLLLKGLNDAQKAAVCTENKHILVLAGAGSGKTRVLVHRIAWILQTTQTTSQQILAVTFTNKAANEMRTRIENLLAQPIGGMWVGTFHGICHRFLRRHFLEASLNENFTLLDHDDQLRVIKQILKAQNIDDKVCPPKKVQWTINNYKDEGIRAASVPQPYSNFQQLAHTLYREYEQHCLENHLVDFAELLLKTYETISCNQNLQNHYHNRFKHLLVDEFQDTNTIQYELIKCLAGKSSTVLVVGDDDQSIYSWRGAKVGNIKQFQQEFTPVELIRLEQNYRSTATILNAANHIISHNDARLGKELWTEGEKGEPILLYEAENEMGEANFIVGLIKQWQERGESLKDAAILYRSNAQSRIIEEGLLSANIPYLIYGGQRFFERAEVKDALAYLRLINNRNDDQAFLRIVNFPTRGIGDKTLATIQTHAETENISLWQAAKTPLFNTRIQQKIEAFTHLIEQLSEDTAPLNLPQKVQSVITGSQLWAYYSEQKSEKMRAKRENLEELVTAADQFIIEDDTTNPLATFLNMAVLEAGETQAAPNEDAVQLMTLHAAKGLEFPLVILTGLEMGVFPSLSSVQDKDRLEEERRLCYVGMTRAERVLALSYACTRNLYGHREDHLPSIFLKEIPKELIQGIHSPYQTRAQNPDQNKSLLINNKRFYPGQIILHKSFGEGTIIDCRQEGSRATVHINFKSVGGKWLDLAYAPLEIIQ